MKRIAGVWIDHEKAVVVDVRGDDLLTRTIRSKVRPRPHWGGAQDGGGEKKYEERHTHELNRFLDDVIAELDPLASLYLFGPGEAKLELKTRLARIARFAQVPSRVESSDKLTDAQIVAKVRELARAPGAL
jgi:uncharacterized protein YceH (UPF0502 family)